MPIKRIDAFNKRIGESSRIIKPDYPKTGSKKPYPNPKFHHPTLVYHNFDEYYYRPYLKPGASSVLKENKN